VLSASSGDKARKARDQGLLHADQGAGLALCRRGRGGDARTRIRKRHQRKGLVLATLSKLKQVCNHPAQFFKDNSAIPGRSGKLTRLVEMLEEVIEGGECALVFSQFAEMGAILERHLEATFGREVPRRWSRCFRRATQI
jgi:SNF2 family DNA or RNA helicase